MLRRPPRIYIARQPQLPRDLVGDEQMVLGLGPMLAAHKVQGHLDFGDEFLLGDAIRWGHGAVVKEKL